jgi:threonine dehydrogenase-like Zn-dependent dehydrogenase
MQQLLSQQHEKGTAMNKLLLTSIAAGALASAALGLAATATAAPSGVSSVDATVSQLRAQGFDVVVNRVGTAPADQCTINAVRPGQTFSRTDSGVAGADDDLVTTVTSRTVYVDITC